jgi:CHAD domain-containing protein
MGSAENTAGAVVLACLHEKTDTLIALEEPARRDEFDAVHRMRVASRTMRSTLKTFGPLFDPTEADLWDAELRWLGSVLGGARDAEVLDTQLSELLARTPGNLVLGPVRERIDQELAPRRDVAHVTLLEALDSERYPALVAGLATFVADPPFTGLAAGPGVKALPSFVDRARRRVRRRMREALPMPSGPDRDAALHQARKAARQTRYAADAVVPLFREQARRLGRQMKTLQDVLGTQHDRIVVGEALEQLGESAHLAGENAFTFGLLHGYAHCDARSLDEKVHEAWHHVGEARRPDWLRER